MNKIKEGGKEGRKKRERERKLMGRHDRMREREEKKKKNREKGYNLPAVVPLCAVCKKKDY